MCGICFICTLSGKSQADVQNSLSVQDSSNVKASTDLLDSSSNLYFNGDGQEILTSKFRNQHEEEIVNTLFTDPLLHHRGPDVSNKHSFTLAEGLDGYMQGCVLHLRGQITPQPVKDAKGNALLWNGEIFDGIQVEEHKNDTQVLFSHLVSSTTEENILRTMQKIHGPWSFIFWQADTHKLWFGRDMFGRRSLLWHLPISNSDHLVLSSVALGEMAYTEIPSVGIFCLDFSNITMSGHDASCPLLTLYPWKSCRWPGTSVAVIETNEADVLTFLYPNLSSCLSVRVVRTEMLDSWIPDVDNHLPEKDERLLLHDFDATNCASLEDMLMHILKNRSDLNALAEELINILQLSVNKRVNNLPRECCLCQNCIRPIGEIENNHRLSAAFELQGSCYSGLDHKINQLSCCETRNGTSHTNVAVLFSGGLDSTILAALADRCVPEGETIDLLNVAFEQPVMKCVNKKQPKAYQKARKSSKRIQNMAAAESCESASNHARYENTQNDVCDNSESLWEKDVSEYTSEPKVKLELNESSTTNQSPFSVAIPSCPNISDHSFVSSKDSISSVTSSDTTNLIDNMIPSVVNTSSSFEVPDRQTGRIAMSELNPNRKWNFVEINVTQAELQVLRKSHIRRLIYPSQTVLDDSIGCAVWFAARGSGVLPHHNGQEFVSTTRVILCGMAADEQFGGYSRHRVTFKTRGWEGLLREIQEEMWRISARNLGRDDRTITDHGKECRFPFLDETFTHFVSSIPVHKRADLRLPRGVGDKLLLRLCALKLGLVKTAAQPKRAIQFGSKIAKLDKRKEKGSDVCERLT